MTHTYKVEHGGHSFLIEVSADNEIITEVMSSTQSLKDWEGFELKLIMSKNKRYKFTKLKLPHGNKN